MRSLLRNMAKAEMVRRGYPKVNRQMHRLYGDWRSLIGAYPTSLTTGKPMAKNFHGKKKYPKGHTYHLFVYRTKLIFSRRGDSRFYVETRTAEKQTLCSAAGWALFTNHVSRWGRDCDSFDAVLRRPHVLC